MRQKHRLMSAAWQTDVIADAARIRYSSSKLANSHRLLYSRNRKNTTTRIAVYTGANFKNAYRYAGGTALHRMSNRSSRAKKYAALTATASYNARQMATKCQGSSRSIFFLLFTAAPATSYRLRMRPVISFLSYRTYPAPAVGEPPRPAGRSQTYRPFRWYPPAW